MPDRPSVGEADQAIIMGFIVLAAPILVALVVAFLIAL